MYKNQLQELAQRSCFNLPSYVCIREGPDHAPRFRASVNFHGEIFQGPSYCTTLRQAEHAAAEVALSNLSTRGTSKSLAARVLDETGVYKNLLQETAHRAGLKLPVYTTVRSGPGHQPIFTSSVELAGMSFSGEPAKTKKQAEKNAAMAAWSALKEMPNLDSLQSKDVIRGEEHEQVMVAGVLSNFKPKDETTPMWQRRIASPHSAMGFRHRWRFNDPLLALPSSNGPKISPLLPLLSKELPSSSKDMNNNFSTLFPSTRPMNEMPDAKGKSIDNNHFTSMPIHESTPKPSYQRAFPHLYQGTQQTQTPFRPSPVHPPRKNSIAGPIPTTMGSGGFSGIAPAVLMRSVIPVCAAPPPSTPSQSKSEIRKNEAQEEILAINLQLNKFQL